MTRNFINDDVWTIFNKTFTEFDKIWLEQQPELSRVNSFELEVPGVKRESVKVYLENRNLVVEFVDRKGRKCKEARFVGQATGAEATLQDGLLTIKINRPESKSTSKIDVEVK